MKSEERILEELKEAVLSYNERGTIELTKESIEAGIAPMRVVEEGLAEGVREIGDKFENGEAFLPHLMVAAKTMKEALRILEPEIKRRGQEVKAKGIVVIGTIEGDIHDIGKNIVALMLEASGFKVYDVGSDAPVDVFVEKAKETNADIIGVSALMTTTMLGQKRLIERLKEQNLYGKFKTMVGGAAVTQEWAEEIQADAYAEDAVDAVKKAELLMGQR